MSEHTRNIRLATADLDRDEVVAVMQTGRDWAVAVLNAGGLTRAERKYWREAKEAYEAFLSEQRE